MPKAKLVNLRTLLGIAVSLLGIYLGFRRFDYQAFLAAIKHTDLLIYFGSMALMVLMVVARAWRWQTLLTPLIPTSLSRAFGAEMVGFFGNNVFPFRLGEILRAYTLAKLQRTSTSAVFGTIVTERILDSLTFTVILLSAALAYPQMTPVIRLSALVVAIVILILAILMYIFYVKKQQVKMYLQRKISLRANQRIIELLNNLWRGMNTLRQTPQLGVIVIQSLLIWVICIVNTWVSGRAMGVNLNLPALLLVFFVTNAAISIPSAPGYVGTYHAASIGALVLVGYTLTQAQALSVILHSVGFITLTLVGLGYFLKYQVDYKQASLEFSEKGED